MQTKLNPPIKGLIEMSFLDWKDKMCSTIFLGGCNFKCPFCHNYELVLYPHKLETMPFSEVLKSLKKRIDWIDHVCITGGEPTVYKDIYKLIKILKDEGFKVKIDTNGYKPDVLERIIPLLDFISMDVKTILDSKRYSKCTGIKININKIKKSIEIIKDSKIKHEFRITVLPKFHNKEIIKEWAETLKNKNGILTLQRFRNNKTLDKSFEQEAEFSLQEFDELVKLVKIVGNG